MDRPIPSCPACEQPVTQLRPIPSPNDQVLGRCEHCGEDIARSAPASQVESIVEQMRRARAV